MPDLIPQVATTGDVWGASLNRFLTQVQSPVDGSLNFGTSRPTKNNTTDIGYTMVDITTRELIRWTGTAWVVLLGGTDKGKQVLTTSLTIYVSNTGNDSNPGTQALPFATIQAAVDSLLQYDLNYKAVTIQLADSTTPYVGCVLKDYLNVVDITIIGNTGNVNAVKVKPAKAGIYEYCFNINGNGYTVKDLSLVYPDAPTNGSRPHGFWVTKSVNFNMGKINFGAFPSSSANDIFSIHIGVDAGGIFNIIGAQGYSITGGATRHMFALGTSRIRCFADLTAKTCSITGNPTFTDSFMVVVLYGTIELRSGTYGLFFSGSATGQKYFASRYGVIDTAGAVSYDTPGTVNGVVETSTYGLYL